MKRLSCGIITGIFVGILVASGIYLLWRWLHLLLTRPLAALGIAAVLGVLILVVWIQDRCERRRALKHMQGRPSLAAEEFGHHYFPPAQAEIAAQVRAIFAKHISVDVSQAHPDDRLVEDLRMDALDSMATLEFVLELEEHFKITIPETAAGQMRSLRDITDMVTRELQAKQRV
jgi:acyl carrier protein